RAHNVLSDPAGAAANTPAAPEASVLGPSSTFNHLYTTNTGLPLKDVYPAAGGLPAETVQRGYATALDLPDTLSGLTGYADGTTYDAWGRVNQATVNAAPNHAFLTNTYDPHTGRLTR